MIVGWRLVKAQYRDTAFNGEGARDSGGRWNRKGLGVVYLADSLALSALETFVHLDRACEGIKYVAFRVEIPDEVRLTTIEREDLKQGWRVNPPARRTIDLGSSWAEGGTTAVLRVPSSIVPMECNLVLNPAHPDFKRIKIAAPKPFAFDPRMWK